MRHLGRHLFALCSAASLLLCVAACVPWTRSYCATGVASLLDGFGRHYRLSSCLGVTGIELTRGYPGGRAAGRLDVYDAHETDEAAWRRGHARLLGQARRSHIRARGPRLGWHGDEHGRRRAVVVLGGRHGRHPARVGRVAIGPARPSRRWVPTRPLPSLRVDLRATNGQCPECGAAVPSA